MLTMQGRASRQIRRLTGVSVIWRNFCSCFSSKWSSISGPAFLFLFVICNQYNTARPGTEAGFLPKAPGRRTAPPHRMG